MKTFLTLLKKAFGIPLFVWFIFFILWEALVGVFTEDVALLGMRFDEGFTEIAIVSLDVVGILLKIWFLGYWFLVACRMANGCSKPLYPNCFKESFVMGIRIFFRLFILSLPLMLVLAGVYWLNTPAAAQFYNWYILFYIVFLLTPFCLYFVSHVQQMPILDGLWTYFKKNANFCFAYLICCAFSYVIWFNVTNIIFDLGRAYSTSQLGLALVSLTPFLLLFYMFFFNAVLLGYFAGKTMKNSESALPTELSAPIAQVATEQPFVKKPKITRKTMKRRTKRAGTTKRSKK